MGNSSAKPAAPGKEVEYFNADADSSTRKGSKKKSNKKSSKKSSKKGKAANASGADVLVP